MTRGARIRLYASALAGVTYVYRGPVRFSTDPEVIQQREAAKAAMQAAAEARAARP